jgi:F-type H+-transporting ATPase subunit epsilon
MWRQAAKVSYLQYSNEMAQILRQCLKEPYREKAMKSAQVFIKEKTFTNGVESKIIEIESLQEAFMEAQAFKPK